MQLIEVDIFRRGWQCNLSRWMYSGEAGSATYRGGCIQERLAVQLVDVDVFRRGWQCNLSRWMYSGEAGSATY